MRGECVLLISLACIPECDPGQTCNQGQCVAVDGACMQPGQLCDPAQPRSNGFFCVDWDGANFADPAACEAPCASDATCPPGGACFLLSYASPSGCFGPQDCQSGELCEAGLCRPAACKRSECEGFWDGQATCQGRYGGLPQFALGATCVELPNEVNFCFPAGSRQLEQSCITSVAAAFGNSFDGACAAGLGCVQGSCKTACREDVHCPGGGTCLFADEDQIARGVGFCGDPCTPFSIGECGDGRKCLPLSEERGFCVPAGERTAGAACTPGQWQCEEGTICADYGALGGQGARCLPMCNIHVAEGGGDIPRVDQAKRDATCPQVEPPARAALEIAQLAPQVGAADLYLDGELLAAGVAFGARAPASGWRYIETGSHTLAARRAGASPQDAPIAERVFSVRRDGGQRVALLDRAGGAQLALIEQQPGGAALAASLVVLAVADAPRVELVALGADDREIGRLGVVEVGQGAEAPMLMAGAVTLALVAPGAPVTAALARFEVTPGAAPEVIALTGTLDPDDGAALAVQRWARAAPALALAEALSWTCTSIDNEGYGVCEQQCRDAEELDGECQGDLLGCQPVLRNTVVGAEAICRPVAAQSVEGSACDPRATTGACGEGLSCVAFGPGAAGGVSSGRCVPQCVVGEEGSCAADRVCASPYAGLFLGRCEWPCTPSGSYADTARCPDGLQTCEPRSVVEVGAGGVATVVETAPICSVSGSIGLGQRCGGDDCQPGAECLYPRSAQIGLAQGLLSPYLGGAGEPTCRAQCDPFDGRRSDTVCGLGETCLPNFPWNADVGHCAPIVETAGAFLPCQRPGESCGPSAVCVSEGAAPFCLKLCQYAGATGPMSYAQSTCASGEECVPLVENIGYCQTRGG